MQQAVRLADVNMDAPANAAEDLMSTEPDNALATDAEIQAALAEADDQSIPSLDDGESPEVVPVPVEANTPARTAASASGSGPSVAVPENPDDQTTDESGAGRLKKLLMPALAALRKLMPAWLRPSPAFLATLRQIGDVVYQTLDTTLWAINYPFRWVGPGARQLIGSIALVTIITSLLAAYLLPILCPPNDVISQIRRHGDQAAAVLAPEPAGPAQAEP